MLSFSKHFGSTDTVFLTSPAESGCPTVRNPHLGVNGKTLRDRLNDDEIDLEDLIPYYL